MFEAQKIKSFHALHDHIVVTDINFDQRITSAGLILMGDDSRSEGIRPRWGRVWAIGPDQTEIKVGQWVLVAHGRWTRGSRVEDASGQHVIRRIDNKDILAISSEPIQDDTISDAVSVQAKSL